jgi:hypothetical protein
MLSPNMNDMQRLSALIGEIYDAAVDPSLWCDVLGKTAGFVGGTSATLFSKDASRKNGQIYYDDGRMEERYKRLYFEKYVKLDPATTGHYFAAPTRTTVCSNRRYPERAERRR